MEPMQPAEQLQGTSHQSPEGLQGSQLHGAASWRGSTGALEAMSASSAAQQQGGESTAASSSRDGAASSPGQRRGSTGHMHMQASNLAMHEGASLAPSISAPSLQSLTSQPTQQPWKVKRPIVDGCPKQKRRDLRKLNRCAPSSSMNGCCGNQSAYSNPTTGWPCAFFQAFNVAANLTFFYWRAAQHLRGTPCNR